MGRLLEREIMADILEPALRMVVWHRSKQNAHEPDG